MKLATTIALVLAPLLVIADGGWHFETSSGRADGFGTKRCQRFYMKKQESFSFKLDKHLKSRSMRIKRAAEPQSGEWGSYNSNGPTNSPANYNPGNSNPPQSYNPGNGNPPQSYNPGNGNPGNYNGPPQTNKPNNNNNNNNKPQQGKPGNNGNGGQWNGPTKPQEIPKCCLKAYQDDNCKDLDNEVCVEDKSDEKRQYRGKAGRDFRSFNIFCTPEPPQQY